MSDTPPLRMDAYYYGFTFTGRIEIDRILSAVATAGKMYHHTSDWNEAENGPAPVEMIQTAANEAAKAIESAYQRGHVAGRLAGREEAMRIALEEANAAAAAIGRCINHKISIPGDYSSWHATASRIYEALRSLPQEAG